MTYPGLGATEGLWLIFVLNKPILLVGRGGGVECALCSPPPPPLDPLLDKALPAGFVSEGSSLEMKLGVLLGTF